MADIFLSYAREDLARAGLLAGALESRGWSVFWDRRIPLGKDFNAYIQQQLDDARSIVVLWSKMSVVSKFVRDEANEGLNDGRLVPALIEEVRQPLGFRQLQAANLADWQSRDAPHDEFERLVISISAIVGPSVASVEPVVATNPAPDEHSVSLAVPVEVITRSPAVPKAAPKAERARRVKQPRPVAARIPAVATNGSASEAGAAATEDDGPELDRATVAGQDDLAPSPGPLSAFAPALASGAIGAVAGGLTEVLVGDTAFAAFGKPFYPAHGVVTGVLLWGALSVLTDAKKSLALQASLLSMMAWFIIDLGGYAYVFSRQQSPTPAALLVLWGALNWSCPFLAAALLSQTARPQLWLLAAAFAGGSAGLGFSQSMVEVFSPSIRWFQAVAGAIFIGLPMACLGYLLTSRPRWRNRR